MPVSCDHVTSFNYGDKKVRDIGFTCWYILSNIMPDSIFHESMRCWIICSILFLFVCLFVCLFVVLLFICCLFFFFGGDAWGMMLLFSWEWKSRWHWLLFSDIWSLNHVRRFQISKFHCVVPLSLYLYVVLFLTTDVAFSFNTCWLRVVVSEF